MIHKFEITADLDQTAAGELLFCLTGFLEENGGRLLAFLSEPEEEEPWSP